VGEYVHVADGGCVFGGVEGDLAIGDGFPCLVFNVNLAGDKKDFLQCILLNRFFKLLLDNGLRGVYQWEHIGGFILKFIS